MLCNPPLNKLRTSLSDESKSFLKDALAVRFRFSEYFFFNREIINRKKLFSNMESDVMQLYLNVIRNSKVKQSEFTIKGLINSGYYGNCYLMKRLKKLYYFKTVRAKLLKSKTNSMDFITMNYIGLLRERDTLLNCGGIWSPKVLQTLNQHNLSIMIGIEAVTGWSLCNSVAMIHAGSCSKCLIYSRRNQMTVRAQSALLTGSVDYIEPLSANIVPFVRFWIAELLVAIRFIHKQGVLHRNLRPNNIIVSSRGHLKLTDFGISSELYRINDRKKSDTNIRNDNTIAFECINCLTELPEAILQPDPFDTRRSVFANRYAYPFKMFGSTAYSAPELHSSSTIAEYTSKCDYWSAGCIFFYMLFMISPFDVTVSTMEEAKLDLSNKSLLNAKLVEKRCRNIPSATQLLLEILCVEPCSRLDDHFEESKWLPESLEFFRGLNFYNLLQIEPPFKPVVMDREMCFDTKPMDAEDSIYEMIGDLGSNYMDPYKARPNINMNESPCNRSSSFGGSSRYSMQAY